MFPAGMEPMGTRATHCHRNATVLVQCQPVSSDVCHCQTWVSVELVCLRCETQGLLIFKWPNAPSFHDVAHSLESRCRSPRFKWGNIPCGRLENSKSSISTHLTALAGKRLTWESKSGSSDTGTLLMYEFGTAETSQVQLKHWSFRVSLKVTD